MRLSASRIVATPAERAWAVLTDWDQQGEWIPATRVTSAGADPPDPVGGRIEAWTGLGRVGFLDSMVITGWDPPRRCEVMHTGRVLRGPGWFAVDSVDASRSRVTWTEDLEIPGGVLGRAAAVVVAAPARLALWIALGRFSRYARNNR